MAKTVWIYDADADEHIELVRKDELVSGGGGGGGGVSASYAQYGNAIGGDITLSAGDNSTFSGWTLLFDPDGIFDASTGKVTADGIYQVNVSFALDSGDFTFGSYPFLGVGFDVSSSSAFSYNVAPAQVTQFVTYVGGVSTSWAGAIAATDGFFAHMYNMDTVTHHYDIVIQLILFR